MTNHHHTQTDAEVELERVEYLLMNELWDNEQERIELRERQTRLLDQIEESRP
jgi:hypothetical protein